MKQKIFVLDLKEIWHKLFSVKRFRVATKEQTNITACPCQELHHLSNEIRLISGQLDRLNADPSGTQEVIVKNINVEKVVLESLSFQLGNIDVDAVNGTMNIGITVNLQSGALSLPGKFEVLDNINKGSDPAPSFEQQISKKKAVYHIAYRPNSSAQDINSKITPVNNN